MEGSMKHVLTYLLMSVLVALVPATTRATCTDPAAVAAARGAIDAQCDCAAATNHGQYVRCAIGVAHAQVRDHRLPWRCKRAVMQCAARSTCGTPGFVACCIPKNG